VARREGEAGGLEGEAGGLEGSSQVVCLARVGAEDQKIVTTTVEDGRALELGPPLHSLVLPGTCHYLEQEALAMWTVA
jgi:diphthine synthase